MVYGLGLTMFNHILKTPYHPLEQHLRGLRQWSDAHQGAWLFDRLRCALLLIRPGKTTQGSDEFDNWKDLRDLIQPSLCPEFHCHLSFKTLLKMCIVHRCLSTKTLFPSKVRTTEWEHRWSARGMSGGLKLFKKARWQVPNSPHTSRGSRLTITSFGLFSPRSLSQSFHNIFLVATHKQTCTMY